LTATTLGAVSDAWTYTGFGEAESYAAYTGNTLAYFAYFARDNAGRITNKVEIIGGATNTFDYMYEPARGWLTDVAINGVPTAHYEYDENGNRADVLTLEREVTYAAADEQDRILSAIEILAGQGAQNLSWTYSANGELQTKTVGTSTSSFSYDVRGSLRGVTLANGTQIVYLVDATGRRVAKKANGVLVQGWLYQDSLKPIAELDGAGNVVSRFVYGSKINVPEYIVRGGTTYRLITDHLGSVRLVVNATDGSIAQRTDYDEFGRVLADTNPGFQPFGFGGGLYDSDTKLVRFGARDYDADSGRWTSKDPIGVSSGSANYFAYVWNDPINWIDPYGKQSQVASSYATTVERFGYVQSATDYLGWYSDFDKAKAKALAQEAKGTDEWSSIENVWDMSARMPAVADALELGAGKIGAQAYGAVAPIAQPIQTASSWVTFPRDAYNWSKEHGGMAWNWLKQRFSCPAKPQEPAPLYLHPNGSIYQGNGPAPSGYVRQ
jgi:RHS repeat-associated protein